MAHVFRPPWLYAVRAALRRTQKAAATLTSSVNVQSGAGSVVGQATVTSVGDQAGQVGAIVGQAVVSGVGDQAGQVGAIVGQAVVTGSPELPLSRPTKPTTAQSSVEGSRLVITAVTLDPPVLLVLPSTTLVVSTPR